MNANPSAPTPTEGSAAVRLGAALEQAQQKTGRSLGSIADSILSDFYDRYDEMTEVLDMDQRDAMLIETAYSWTHDHG